MSTHNTFHFSVAQSQARDYAKSILALQNVPQPASGAERIIEEQGLGACLTYKKDGKVLFAYRVVTNSGWDFVQYTGPEADFGYGDIGTLAGIRQRLVNVIEGTIPTSYINY